jgi:hypothetical protein
MKFLPVSLLLASFSTFMTVEGKIDYNRDVRPILAGKCYACHGPDKETRKAKLRLDDRASALKKEAFVPGKPDESELVYRVFTKDSDEIMPPPESKDSLTAEQKEILQQWVKEGAEYSVHWAFVPPQRAVPPKTKKAGWVRNEIDRFVLGNLESQGLDPSPEATRHTLVRRLYLDLIGLPPTPEEVDAFVKDENPKAYENLVGHLLKSPKYGERWARSWLDLARYADTNGYEKDRPRTIWPYRDWVIKALNEDMPFDQFSIEQLAGDMLPHATSSQIVATGFHRNTMLNEEGGIDPLEFRFHAMVDRVATTGTVWMGLSTGCAQCHTHKYDPITHDEYYQMMAFLDNVEEPDFLLESEQQAKQKVEIERQIEQKAVSLQKEIAGFDDAFAAWMNKVRKTATNWTTIRPVAMKTNLPKLELMEDGSIFSSGDVTKRDVFDLNFTSEAPITALRLEVLPDDRLPQRGPGRCYYEGRKGDFFLSEFTIMSNGQKWEIAEPTHSYGKISIGGGGAKASNVIDGDGSSGWSTSGQPGKAHHLVLPLKKPIPANTPFSVQMLFERHFVVSLGRFRLSVTSDTVAPVAKKHGVEVEAILAQGEKASKAQLAHLRRHFLESDPRWQKQRKPLDVLKRKIPRLGHTMVMLERPPDNPRPTYLHHRGEYVSPRHQVKPGVPAVFSTITKNPPKNRLAFARWLVSEQNPLGDRVVVNRAWRSFFGAGLLRTSGDFGTQSAAPDHPELLDWLAVEFRKQGMSLKKLHRLIVTSATYRQDSKVGQELLARDPNNRLLARGPRHRLDAEVIRDLMLKASGKLSSKMYGPSVYPPQPASVSAVAYGATKWNVSKGEDRYRRSLYTFSKRTAPFAAFTTFDASSGEGCIARRNRSNTPLQALTLLNDAMFVELAQHLAREVEKQAVDKRIEYLFRKFLTRPPSANEMDLMKQYLDTQRQRLGKGELKASQIMGQKNATAEQAALALLARSIMNLDETVTKQ